MKLLSKRSKMVLILSIITVCSLTVLTLAVIRLIFNRNISNFRFLAPALELEPKFLIDNNNVFLSASSGTYYNLYKYSNGALTPLIKGTQDIFYPFIFKGRVCGLSDHNGDENYRTNDTELNQLLGNNFIKVIFSFDRAKLLFVQYKNDDKLYELDLIKKSRRPLLNKIRKVNSVSLSKNGNYLAVSYDGKLIAINLKDSLKKFEFVRESQNELNKSNPFFDQDCLIFSSNSNSQFYEIFKTDLTSISPKRSLLFSSNHDVLMPKLYGDNLFFLEIVNSEYLLRVINLKTGRKQELTRNGVIYNYEICSDGDIICTYSNLNTPKSLLKIHLPYGTSIILAGGAIQIEIKQLFIPQTIKRSAAYIILPPIKQEKRGVVLFFHPGLHADFSPRWEITLSNLALNGYTIVSPNYPGSVGFGKDFFNSNETKIFDDISQWDNYIHLKYPRLPYYYLSSSSGNLIMEKALMSQHRWVTASASLFGVPDYYNENNKNDCLYILGKNDPVVPFAERESILLKMERMDADNIYGINDEGHWLRKQKNQLSVTKRISNFFFQNRGISVF